LNEIEFIIHLDNNFSDNNDNNELKNNDNNNQEQEQEQDQEEEEEEEEETDDDSLGSDPDFAGSRRKIGSKLVVFIPMRYHCIKHINISLVEIVVENIQFHR
jgi:hypothetical protein